MTTKDLEKATTNDYLDSLIVEKQNAIASCEEHKRRLTMELGLLLQLRERKVAVIKIKKHN